MTVVKLRLVACMEQSSRHWDQGSLGPARVLWNWAGGSPKLELECWKTTELELAVFWEGGGTLQLELPRLVT